MPQWVHMRPEKGGCKLDHTYYPADISLFKQTPGDGG
jgi:hypothetical protein